MDEDFLYLYVILLAGIFVVGGVVGTIVPMWTNSDIQELGNLICDQEYNLEFDSYSKGELKCKQPEQTEAYDGIVINIGNKEDN